MTSIAIFYYRLPIGIQGGRQGAREHPCHPGARAVLTSGVYQTLQDGEQCVEQANRKHVGEHILW